MEGSNTKYKPMKHDLKILENVISKSLLVSAPWWIIDRLSLTPTDMLWLAGIYSQLGAKWKCCKSLCSTQLWEVKVITLQKSILYLGKQTLFVFVFLQRASRQKCVCYRSLIVSSSAVSVFVLGLLAWDFADARHVVFQIRPSDGGYGFTLEERNRVPIIKFVEKGSPAEVTRSHTQRCTKAQSWSFFCTSLKPFCNVLVMFMQKKKCIPGIKLSSSCSSFSRS